MFDKDYFFDLERRLIDAGLDSDEKSFAEIKATLQNPPIVSADDFAVAAIYVVLASGFSQKTAKIIHKKIMSRLEIGDSKFDDLFSIFHNKNKINSIVKIWENRAEYAQGYYAIKTAQSAVIPPKGGIQCCAAVDPGPQRCDELLEEKLKYLSSLPHIGKITANHLARNLGENVFKRDVWIDRLLKQHGEDLLEKLAEQTNLPIGYVDVVLWKACQVGMIKI